MFHVYVGTQPTTLRPLSFWDALLVMCGSSRSYPLVGPARLVWTLTAEDALDMSASWR